MSFYVAAIVAFRAMPDAQQVAVYAVVVECGTTEQAELMLQKDALRLYPVADGWGERHVNAPACIDGIIGAVACEKG